MVDDVDPSGYLADDERELRIRISIDGDATDISVSDSDSDNDDPDINSEAGSDTSTLAADMVSEALSLEQQFPAGGFINLRQVSTAIISQLLNLVLTRQLDQLKHEINNGIQLSAVSFFVLMRCAIQYSYLDCINYLISEHSVAAAEDKIDPLNQHILLFQAATLYDKDSPATSKCMAIILYWTRLRNLASLPTYLYRDQDRIVAERVLAEYSQCHRLSF